MISPFLASLALIFVSELAGTTELVIFSLAMRHKAFLSVFTGALLAHAVLDGAAVLVGAGLASLIPQQLVMMVAGAAFTIMGVFGLLKRGKKKRKLPKADNIFLKTFGLVALAEVAADRTFLASGLLAAEYRVVLPVYLGIVLALALAIGANVFVGTFVVKKLPYKIAYLASALLFIIFGIISVIQAF